MMFLLLALHTLAAVLWVGGMFFALVVLRPAADGLDGPERLRLWRRVFARFFPWVWVAVATLLVTGYIMLFGFFGGFARAGIHIHLMNGLGLIMDGLYAWLWFVLWPRFRAAVDAGLFDEAPQRLGAIRRIVTTNLVLGILTVITGAAGAWLGA